MHPALTHAGSMEVKLHSGMRTAGRPSCHWQASSDATTDRSSRQSPCEAIARRGILIAARFFHLRFIASSSPGHEFPGGTGASEVKDPLMRKIRCLDKLIDELAKGKAMEKILRQ